MKVSGALPEWTLHGVSTKIDELKPGQSGIESTEVYLSYHLTRKSAYYFWKALPFNPGDVS